MIAKKEDSEPIAETPLPNSRKVYVAGNQHVDLRVPFREIALAPTKTMSGEIEVNDPVRVYDTSGPWGDADQHVDVEHGLPPLRAKWIRDRGDVEEIEGRAVKPIDDGYLSVAHAEHLARRNGTTNDEFRMSNGSERDYQSTLNSQLSTKRRPLRASADCAVTQLWYARQGTITPEMEFIAIRESGTGFQPVNSNNHSQDGCVTNSLAHQHAGEAFGANIPREITPEFVR